MSMKCSSMCAWIYLYTFIKISILNCLGMEQKAQTRKRMRLEDNPSEVRTKRAHVKYNFGCQPRNRCGESNIDDNDTVTIPYSKL